ncbi:MAG TPA: TPM domain-containing protein [Sphingobium sp.]
MQLSLALAMALLLLPTAQSCTKAEQQPERPLLAQPDGPVLDMADILPAEEEVAMDRHLRSYFARTGDAIVLVSVTSLQGRSVEDFAYNLFNQWGIGDAKTNRGVLLLIAPNERKVRIEVGCGLENPIGNDVAGRIVRHDIVPAFTKGDLKGGAQAGIAALEKQLAARSARGPVATVSCREAIRKAA